MDGYGKFDDSDKKKYGWEMKFVVDSHGLVFGCNDNSKAVGTSRKIYRGELKDGRMDVMVEVEGSPQRTHYTGFVLDDEFQGHFEIVTGTGRSGTLWGKVTTTELSPGEALEYTVALVRARALHNYRRTMGIWTVKSALLNVRDAARSKGSKVIALAAKGDELIEVSMDGAWLQCKLMKDPSIVGWVQTASAEPYVLKNAL